MYLVMFFQAKASTTMFLPVINKEDNSGFMAVEVGEIVEGKVTGLTKFGAFFELPEGKVGMVHISEVSTDFVKDIADYLEEGQTVNVKVLNIDKDGKISLSIKQAPGEQLKKIGGAPDQEKGSFKGNRERGGNFRGEGRPQRRPKRRAPNVWNGTKANNTDDSELSFEEKMAKFKQESDDKLSDLKRSTEAKNGGFTRRGGSNQYH